MPIAYEALQTGVQVRAADGDRIGTVRKVVADVNEDIFHGLVLDTDAYGQKFIAADEVAALYERGVELRINAAQVGELPAPWHGR